MLAPGTDIPILSERVIASLPIYWQEFARYHAEIGQLVIKNSEEQREA
jgi:hypothetical protein